MSSDPTYCSTCYSEAAKKGRAVALTQLYKYPICGLCEQRMREGLVHYRPSNGTEFNIFEERCEQCRHHIDDPHNPLPGKLTPPYNTCAWGILDRFWVQMGSKYDDIAHWFDPADIDPSDCPATCKRFTHKDDPDDGRNPPRPVDPAQMTFGELLAPVENVPATRDALAGGKE